MLSTIKVTMINGMYDVDVEDDDGHWVFLCRSSC